MAATVAICERTGTIPGIITENISNINWKAVDDTITPYTNSRAFINVGSNSYAKYNYIRFNGLFTTIANVTITHVSGTLPPNVRLVSSQSIVSDSNKIQFNTPTRTYNTAITSYDISGIGSSVSLLVGPPLSSASDPAYAPNKLILANNTAGALYTNYFVTQLLVGNNVGTGSIGNIVLQITYDEA